jgi:hypothetical protein
MTADETEKLLIAGLAENNRTARVCALGIVITMQRHEDRTEVRRRVADRIIPQIQTTMSDDDRELQYLARSATTSWSPASSKPSK